MKPLKLESEGAVLVIPPRGESVGQWSVLVVDDHPMVRAGVVSVLNADSRFTVLGEAADGLDGLTKAKALLPDLVVMDISLPKMSGLAVTRTLRAEVPTTKVVLLSMYPPEKVCLAVMRSGARAYVWKQAATVDLLKALDTVIAGRTYFGSASNRRTAERIPVAESEPPRKELSARERDVLVALADGLSNKEVASRLDLGVRTIETHRDKIMRKLDIHSVAGLTRFAIQQGMISIS